MARGTGSKRRTGSSGGTKPAVKTKSANSLTKPKKAATRKSKQTKHDDDCEDSNTNALKELDSDALDEEEDAPGKKRKKFQRSPKKMGNTPLKKQRRKQEEDQDEEDEDLPEGLTVVGEVVRAPTEGRVPPGKISQNTLDFLKQLAKPEYNDREWFRLHEPVFRQAEKEWKDWIEVFTPVISEVDDQIPELPPKDVIHRIYRDVRFSNDKTPYKQGFSASFSRSGRKAFLLWRLCRHLSAIIPGGRSLVAAGAWQPGKNELATMRHHILRNSSRLRNVISDPEFVKFFGKPSPHPKGEQQNIFGHEDELKVAPKGIDKNHKEINLLKLRSVAVMHHFLDSEVTATDFMDNVRHVVEVMRPLVHCLNDMMTLPVDESDESSEEEA
ncbi:hypothetical protein JB92DRAFT_1823346 [Gautieria morchelliformis]|nr:hypothetical protein JB92DRAFT_1823346 [Gautieria morchelliformis]